MKQFVVKTIILILAVLATVILLKFLLPHEKNYNSAMVDKLELLKINQNKRKIVLIGGSSVGWGLSARQIENALDITTINLGHHAGFGLVDYQDFIISCIGKDDIVVFSPEWEFYNEPNFNDNATLQDLHANLNYWSITNRSKFDRYKSQLISKLSFSIFSINDTGNEIGPYIYECLNQNGDVISHCGLSPTGPKKYRIDFSNVNVRLFVSTFKFLSKSKFVIMFPPTQKSVYDDNIILFEKIQMDLSKSKLNYLDSIKSNVYSDSEFFDAQYHLKCESAQKRTEKLIRYLQTQVAN
jgi:hypothetical protein